MGVLLFRANRLLDPANTDVGAQTSHGPESRLMSPACGNRRVTVVFEPPSNAQARSG
jgi:hypothetical protein